MRVTKKSEAVKLFGSIKEMSDAVGVSPSAISQWSEDLSRAKQDRVEMALLRRQARIQLEAIANGK